MNRREVLGLARTTLLLSSATLAASPLLAAKREKRDMRPAALLVPLTGPRASLGSSMQSAAMLAKITANGLDGDLIVLDTGGSAQGAASAAAQAMKRGAAIILGPIFADEVRAAAAAVAGKVPLIAFTNDSGVQGSGAHVFGITASQSTTAVLRYARSRGVRRVIVIGDGSPWSNAAGAAATGLQGEIGIDVQTVDLQPGQPVPQAGDAPDAVLIPGSGETLIAAARNLTDTGVQLLATVQGVDNRPAALAALNGAWLASVDPDGFGAFAGAYEARNGGDPGAISALAYDAMTISEKLRQAHAIDRAGLLNSEGFDCITGPVRFRTDGSCARQFAILVAGPDGYEKVAVSQGT